MDKTTDKLRMRLPLPSGEFTLKTPVLTASGTFGYGLEFEQFGNLSTLGGIVTKGLSLKPRQGNPMPRIAETSSGMLNSVGLQNCGVDHFMSAYLPRLAAAHATVITNIYATSEADFAELARILSAAQGVSVIEANISCPNVREGGVQFGQNAAMAAKVTEAVKKAAGNVPVMIKLSPNVTDITEIAKACESAGADMLSCINTITGMAIDVKTRRPMLAGVTGGLSGAAIKPVALRCVWQVAGAVKIPVIGIGGVNSAQDVLEFMLAGAYGVQIGTANFTRPDRAFSMAGELLELMNRLEIDNLEDFRGTLELPE